MYYRVNLPAGTVELNESELMELIESRMENKYMEDVTGETFLLPRGGFDKRGYDIAMNLIKSKPLMSIAWMYFHRAVASLNIMQELDTNKCGTICQYFTHFLIRMERCVVCHFGAREYI